MILLVLRIPEVSLAFVLNLVAELAMEAILRDFSLYVTAAAFK